MPQASGFSKGLLKHSWFLTVFCLVSCHNAITETKEYSCAPQNIHYNSDSGFDILECDSAIPASKIEIYCNSDTYSNINGESSCISDQVITGTRPLSESSVDEEARYIIKPIILTSEELFSKKEECGNLIPQIVKFLKDRDETMTESDGSSGVSSVLDKVFYSVSINSCLYTDKETYFSTDGVDEVYFNIYDALTNEQLGGESWQRGDGGVAAAENALNKDLILYQ